MLTERIKRVEGEMPNYVLDAFARLEKWPNSERLANNAVLAAKSVVSTFARPIPLITKMAVVVFTENGEDKSAVEYVRDPVFWSGKSDYFSDFYSLHVGNKETCITRNPDMRDQVTHVMRPTYVEIIEFGKSKETAVLK